MYVILQLAPFCFVPSIDLAFSPYLPCTYVYISGKFICGISDVEQKPLFTFCMHSFKVTNIHVHIKCNSHYQKPQ